MKCELKFSDHPPYGRLAYRTFGTHDSARGTLFLLHGLGEHSGRWEWICRWFAEKGWHCVVPDHFGHGLSAGRRGHIARFGIWSNSIAHLRKELPINNESVFLFGHSLGGLIGIDAVHKTQNHWKGCVFSAPWLQLSLEGRAFERKLARLASRWWPTLSFPTGLRADQMAGELLVSLTSDHGARIHKRITARAYMEILGAAARAFKVAPHFHLPCLLTHGSEDPVMSITGSRSWLKACGSKEKRLHIIDGGRHEPHHDLHREAVLEVIQAWLQQQSQ